MIVLQDLLCCLTPVLKYALVFWFLYRRNRLSPLSLQSLTEVMLMEFGLFLRYALLDSVIASGKRIISNPFLSDLIEIALVEELLKYLAGFLYTRKYGHLASRYSTVVLFATSALTFSLTEDIEYIIASNNALSMVWTRFNSPAHVAYGIEMGFFSGLAWEKAQQGENRKSVLFRIASIAVPTLHHFLWNWSANNGKEQDGFFIVFCLLFGIGFYIIFFWSRKLAKKDRFIVPPEEEQTQFISNEKANVENDFA